MKIITTSNGFSILVDDDDYITLNVGRWTVSQTTKGRYYAQKRINVNGKRVLKYMHRIILNAKEGELVDHRDGNGLNNQRANIRICTASQNQMNCKCRSQWRFKGIEPVKSKRTQNSWAAYIVHHGRKISLGRFKTAIDAARAYNHKSLELFGEFANLNAA